jgi:hypothetical protein
LYLITSLKSKSKCKLNVTRIYSCQVQITIKNNIYLKPQTLNYEKKVLTVMVNNSTKYQQSEKPHRWEVDVCYINIGGIKRSSIYMKFSMTG